MLHEPLLGMVRMESVVTVDTEHDESSHHLRLGRLSGLLLSSVSGEARFRHWVWRSQPESTDSASGHMPTAAWTNHSGHRRRAQRIPRGGVDDLARGRWCKLRGGIVLGKRSGTVIASQTDLLSRWLNQFSTVPGDGEFAGTDIESCSFQLQLPGINLPTVRFAPRFKAGSIRAVINETWDGVAHGKDRGLHVVEFPDV